MSKNDSISMSVIRRLPRYYRFLSELNDQNIDKISSTKLAQIMNVTASQVRQDLNCFGGFGQQGYGYSVSQLKEEIKNILGLNNDYKAILIGAGNLGKAVAMHMNFEKLGFELYATSGTASMLNRNMIATNFTYRIHEDKEPNVISLLESGKINYVISTSETGRKPALDSVKIRRKSVERSIACLTSVDTANALVKCIAMDKTVDDLEMVDITKI